MEGPFTKDKFSVNIPETTCLTRDYVPWIMNTFADPAVVEHVASQPDYTTFVRALENIPSFDEPNIHGSGHFGVGGVLGTLGNVNHSPGGELSFYIYFRDARSNTNSCRPPILPPSRQPRPHLLGLAARGSGEPSSRCRRTRGSLRLRWEECYA